jgi:hypothetical protein
MGSDGGAGIIFMFVVFLVVGAFVLGITLGTFGVGKPWGIQQTQREAAEAGAGKWTVDPITSKNTFVWLPAGQE